MGAYAKLPRTWHKCEKTFLFKPFPNYDNVCVCKKVFNESIVLIFIVSATNVSWYQNMCPPTRLRAEAGSLGSMSKEPRGFGLDRRRQVPSPTLCWRQGAYMPVRMYYEGTSCTSPLPSGGVSL